MCTSCTGRSRLRICPVLHGFTMESASASLTSLPGTYLMLTSYCCIRSSYALTWVGQRRDIWCRWTFRVQCWSSDFLFQSATYWRMRWGHWLAAGQPESSLRSLNVNDEWLCTVMVFKQLIGGDGLLQV